MNRLSVHPDHVNLIRTESVVYYTLLVAVFQYVTLTLRYTYFVRSALMYCVVSVRGDSLPINDSTGCRYVYSRINDRHARVHFSCGRDTNVS